MRDARQDIVRIQKVIWDHLLAFQGEIIQKQAFFSLPFGTPNNRPFYSSLLSYLAMNASEAGGDLVLIQTSLLFSCK